MEISLQDRNRENFQLAYGLLEDTLSGEDLNALRGINLGEEFNFSMADVYNARAYNLFVSNVARCLINHLRGDSSLLKRIGDVSFFTQSFINPLLGEVYLRRYEGVSNGC
jgi:hypothetical protein